MEQPMIQEPAKKGQAKLSLKQAMKSVRCLRFVAAASVWRTTAGWLSCVEGRYTTTEKFKFPMARALGYLWWSLQIVTASADKRFSCHALRQIILDW
ncbi:uncharacterized protein LAJ45_10399 [Morchella importuna]|uniref:uncharacterized protein n=1 Tax=Morchella importuna TaxID=1174673 RepID=UPI001E8D334C|nr:uncharacterized protein LAJ45_10399 [Morchella importuna]KAH8145598.1 hypothetical protein LAJ45_10399 [Morchella importuna]